MLSHELIHAYDHCRAQVDFLSNIQHLACTEVSGHFLITALQLLTYKTSDSKAQTRIKGTLTYL